MFDIVLEIVLELIFEGMTASLGSKKVPLIIRIFLAFILVGFFAFFSFFILYAGIASDNKPITFLGIVVIISFASLTIGKIRKYKKDRHNG